MRNSDPCPRSRRKDGENEIANNSFMPESCMQGDVDTFYKEMAKHEAISSLVYTAAAAGKKLKLVPAI